MGYTYLQMWESDFGRAVDSTVEMKSNLTKSFDISTIRIFECKINNFFLP